MRRTTKSALALALTASLVISGATVSDAAAKKPKLSKTKATVYVGKTVKITVKKAKPKKTTWSISKKAKKYVSLSKKKKTSVTIKGKKKGKATVTAKIKVGKKTYKKTVKVTVKNKKKKATATKKVTTTPAPNNGGTKATPTPNNGGTKPTATATAPAATATATTAPTATATTEPTATATTEPTATAPATVEDITVKMSADTEYGKGAVENQVYNEDGTASYDATNQYAGGGVAWYVKEDKSGVKISDYKTLVIRVKTNQNGTPVVLRVFGDTAGWWSGKEVIKPIYGSTAKAAGNYKTFVIDLSAVQYNTDFNADSSIFAVALKYNAWLPEGSTEVRPTTTFTFDKILLSTKEASEFELDPDPDPEPTATPEPTLEPTPTATAEPTPTAPVESNVIKPVVENGVATYNDLAADQAYKVSTSTREKVISVENINKAISKVVDIDDLYNQWMGKSEISREYADGKVTAVPCEETAGCRIVKVEGTNSRADGEYDVDVTKADDVYTIQVEKTTGAKATITVTVAAGKITASATYNGKAYKAEVALNENNTAKSAVVKRDDALLAELTKNENGTYKLVLDNAEVEKRGFVLAKAE